MYQLIKKRIRFALYILPVFIFINTAQAANSCVRLFNGFYGFIATNDSLGTLQITNKALLARRAYNALMTEPRENRLHVHIPIFEPVAIHMLEHISARASNKQKIRQWGQALLQALDPIVRTAETARTDLEPHPATMHLFKLAYGGTLFEQIREALAEGRLTQSHMWDLTIAYTLYMEAAVNIDNGITPKQFADPLVHAPLDLDLPAHIDLQLELFLNPDAFKKRVLSNSPNALFLFSHKSTHISDLNDISTLPIFFVELVDRVTDADGAKLGPLKFLLHELIHALFSMGLIEFDNRPTASRLWYGLSEWSDEQLRYQIGQRELNYLLLMSKIQGASPKFKRAVNYIWFIYHQDEGTSLPSHFAFEFAQDRRSMGSAGFSRRRNRNARTYFQTEDQRLAYYLQRLPESSSYSELTMLDLQEALRFIASNYGPWISERLSENRTSAQPGPSTPATANDDLTGGDNSTWIGRRIANGLRHLIGQ